jgi:hypothetical protein
MKSLYERTKAQVYATNNKWAIENFHAIHDDIQPCPYERPWKDVLNGKNLPCENIRKR